MTRMNIDRPGEMAIASPERTSGLEPCGKQRFLLLRRRSVSTWPMGRLARGGQRFVSLRRRTPLLAVLSALLIVLTLASSCRLGGPTRLVDEGADKRLDNSFTEENHAAILEYLDSNIVRPQHGGQVFSAYHILGSSSNRIYVWALCEEYVKGAEGELERGSGASMPVVLSVEIRDSLLYVTGHKNPRDGSMHAADIRSLFPRELHDQVFNIRHGDVIGRLSERVENRARKAFGH